MRVSGLVAAVLFSAACSPGCSAALSDRIAAFDPSKPPNTDGVLRLMGRFGAAHACPVSPTYALTAAHVVDLRPFDLNVPPYPYLWSDGLGNGGQVKALAMGDSRDLAILVTSTPFARFYEIPDEPPVEGTQVWLMGYDFRDRGRAFSPRVFSTRVLRVVAGHVFLAQAGWPSTSGSCVLNARGEVVAINIGGKQADNGAEVGIAVGAWLLRKAIEAAP